MFFLNLHQHSQFTQFSSKANPTQSLKTSKATKFKTTSINKHENINWVKPSLLKFSSITSCFPQEQASFLLEAVNETNWVEGFEETNPLCQRNTHLVTKTVRCSVFDQNKGKGQVEKKKENSNMYSWREERGEHVE